MERFALLQPNADGTGTLMTYDEAETYLCEYGRADIYLEMAALRSFGQTAKEDMQELVEKLHMIPWGSQLLSHLRCILYGEPLPSERIGDNHFLTTMANLGRADIFDDLFSREPRPTLSESVLETLFIRFKPEDQLWHRALQGLQSPSISTVVTILRSGNYVSALPYLSCDDICTASLLVPVQRYNELGQLGYVATAEHMLAAVYSGRFERVANSSERYEQASRDSEPLRYALKLFDFVNCYGGGGNWISDLPLEFRSICEKAMRGRHKLCFENSPEVYESLLKDTCRLPPEVLYVITGIGRSRELLASHFARLDHAETQRLIDLFTISGGEQCRLGLEMILTSFG
jgi:hypothetical protein